MIFSVVHYRDGITVAFRLPGYIYNPAEKIVIDNKTFTIFSIVDIYSTVAGLFVRDIILNEYKNG